MYNITTPWVDDILIDMTFAKEIKKLNDFSSVRECSGFQESYWHLTLHGAWELHRLLKNCEIDIKQFQACCKEAENAVLSDPLVSVLFNKFHGPFISLETPPIC